MSELGAERFSCSPSTTELSYAESPRSDVFQPSPSLRSDIGSFPDCHSLNVHLLLAVLRQSRSLRSSYVFHDFMLGTCRLGFQAHLPISGSQRYDTLIESCFYY